MEFLVLDADYTRAGSDFTGSAVIRLFGRLKGSRKRIIVQIRDFHPYFFGKSTLEELERIVGENRDLADWIISIKREKKRRYYKGLSVELLRVTGRTPWVVPRVSAMAFPQSPVYEDDIPFIKRFFIDTRLRCFHHASLSKYIEISRSDGQIVVECSYRDISYSGEDKKTVSQLSFMSFDIEIDEMGEALQDLMEKKSKRVLAISGAVGTNPGKFQDFVFVLEEDSLTAEKKLLERFVSFVEENDPDVIAGYNSEMFDWPYLLQRMKVCGVNPARLSPGRNYPYKATRGHLSGYRITGRIITDVARRTWGIHPITGRKGLDDVSRHIFGEDIGKIQRDCSIGELYREHREEFTEYSLRDAILTYRLIFRLGIAEKIELLKLAGYPSFDGILTTERNIGEFELMRKLSDKNILIPSKPGEIELKFRREFRRAHPHKGGEVFGPVGTLHEQVLITDFASMYPSIIRSYNIGLETMIDEKLARTDPERAFHSRPESCIASLQAELLSRRGEAKAKIKELETAGKNAFDEISNYKRLQRSLKLVSNSLYGSHTFIHGRFYSAELADAITEIGRSYIKNLGKWITKYPVMDCEMVYGDTDSAFIKITKPEGLIREFFDEEDTEIKNVLYSDLQVKIDDLLNYLSDFTGKNMHLEQEDLAFRIAFAPRRKKAYAYLSAYSRKLIIKGFEAVRKDWSPIARRFQRELLELLLSTNDLAKARKFVIETAMSILKGPPPVKEDVTILAPVRGGPSAYKSITPGVAAYL
ncbi:MAG: DNA polymerase domain-containing protein, partial [Candidatus Hodarchaeales archaeon]